MSPVLNRVRSDSTSPTGVAAAWVRPPMTDRTIPAPRGRARPIPWSERWTRPWVCVAVGIVSLALLGWNWAAQRVLATTPTAIPRMEAGTAIVNTDPITLEAIAGLRQQIEQAASRLVKDRSEFRQHLAQIEADARRLGLRLELSVSPHLVGYGGHRELTAYPVTARISKGEGGTLEAYPALTEWIEGVVDSPRQIEVAGLRVNGTESGFLSAVVRLRFLGRTTDEDLATP